MKQLALVLCLAGLSAPAAAEPEPWYFRESCRSIVKDIFAARLDEAEAQIADLAKSGDPDDRACAAWLRVASAEIQIAVGGQLPALFEHRKRVLHGLYSFAKAHAKLGPRFADLELEARTRRIRLLVLDGEKSAAIDESRAVKRMLEARGAEVPETPSMLFVRGITNIAVSSSPWPLRMVLKIAGLSGDAKVAVQDLGILIDSGTVYAYEATYSAHHFSNEDTSGPLGPPMPYIKKLLGDFPDNPQFIYDYALDLANAKRCKDSLAYTASARKRLDATPGLWTGPMRARLLWISGRCALETGDKTQARRYAERARAENYAVFNERIDDLLADI